MHDALEIDAHVYVAREIGCTWAWGTGNRVHMGMGHWRQGTASVYGSRAASFIEQQEQQGVIHILISKLY